MNDSQNLQHLLIIESQKYRKIITLEENSYSLGRAPENSIIIQEDLNVSRYHASLLKKKDSKNNQDYYWIIDGDLKGTASTNGLSINGQFCSKHKLKHRDKINFGERTQARYYILDSSSVEKIFQIEKKLNQESLPSAKTRNKNYQPTIVSNQKLNILEKIDSFWKIALALILISIFV
ncbi:MAG: FHA domain-containing protein [Prochloraceae cyanobacterium]